MALRCHVLCGRALSCGRDKPLQDVMREIKAQDALFEKGTITADCDLYTKVRIKGQSQVHRARFGFVALSQGTDSCSRELTNNSADRVSTMKRSG